MWILYIVIGLLLWTVLGFLFTLLFWPKIAEQLDKQSRPRH